LSVIRRLLAGCVLMLAFVVVPAGSASAHAVLLRTSPSPQSTVPTSPSAVTLTFSESVDVAFGAIRLYDVDGHRVDAGEVRTAGNGSTVELPVPHLKDGSYAVTWHVVSADGHAVRGGFLFYVGHPSAISPVVPAADKGVGRAVGVGYGVVRFAWYVALFLLVGAVVFRRAVWSPARAAVGVVEDGGRSPFRRLLLGGWLALAATLVLLLVFQSATVSGLPLLRAAAPSTLGQVLHTRFGGPWQVEALLTLALLLPVIGLARRGGLADVPAGVWLGLAGVLVAATAALHVFNGHARTDSSPALAVTSASVHLLSAGVWVGGLAAFVVLGLPSLRGVPSDRRATLLAAGVRRFSAVAVAAVVVVTLTGTINSLFEFGALSDLWRLPYGRAVSAKILLMAIALALGARHLLLTRRRLAGPESDAAAASFGRTTRAETVVLTCVVAVAAALVVMVPGRSVALRATGEYVAEHKVAGVTVQAIVDPTRLGPNEVHLTYVDSSGLASAAFTRVSATLVPPTGASRPVAMRLISPGHFVGDATLATPGRYRLTTSGQSPAGTTATSFAFTVRKGG
jgi:copper transport protein